MDSTSDVMAVAALGAVDLLRSSVRSRIEVASIEYVSKVDIKIFSCVKQFNYSFF
jgi:hypothetical protein